MLKKVQPLCMRKYSNNTHAEKTMFNRKANLMSTQLLSCDKHCV